MYTLLLLNGGIGSNRIKAAKTIVRLRRFDIHLLLKALSAIPEITHMALNYPSGWRDVFVELLTDYGLSDKYV